MNRGLLFFLLPAVVWPASNYQAEKVTDQGVEVVRLTDNAHGVSVSIVPSIGNRAYEMKVHGKNILFFPAEGIGAYKQSGAKGINGIPFLAPWANRMADSGFWANGKNYKFNGELGTVRLDNNGIAIHGLLTGSDLWEVTSIGANRTSAHVTSRLDFYKYPGLMANWPFAHSYEMTYTLSNGVLEVTTKVTNLGKEAMPVSLGFHPYFQLPDVDRSEATAHIPARKHVETDKHLVATGEFTPANLPDQVSLKDHLFDDGYTDLIREPDGRATFSVSAGARKIEVIYGPHYQVGVVYAPAKQPYICFEPMSAITNGVNLAHEGKYPELQSVAPGATWQESFWVRASGI